MGRPVVRRSTSREPALRELDAAEWDAVAARAGCDDVYLRHAYLDASALLAPGRPTLLHLAAGGGDVLFACLLREIPGTPMRDVATPYGYGGPVAFGAEPPVDEFHRLYEDWCRDRGVVTTFAVLHPLLENHRYASPGARLERLADSASWSLEASADLFAGMHRSHRNKCRKARAAGVEVSVACPPAETDSFADLHLETMRRLGAAPFYFFPPAYWKALAEGLAEAFVRFDALVEGRLVGSAVCLAGGSWLHYHMGVTSEAGRLLGAGNLLVYEAARWGREVGLAEFHLGSGAGGRRDSLWEFKHRFGTRPREVWIGKLVHDADAYRRLTGGAGIEGFFPAYRDGAREAGDGTIEPLATSGGSQAASR